MRLCLFMCFPHLANSQKLLFLPLFFNFASKSWENMLKIDFDQRSTQNAGQNIQQGCSIWLYFDYFIPVYAKYTTNGTVCKSKYVLDVCGWYMLVCLHIGINCRQDFVATFWFQLSKSNFRFGSFDDLLTYQGKTKAV